MGTTINGEIRFTSDIVIAEIRKCFHNPTRLPCYIVLATSLMRATISTTLTSEAGLFLKLIRGIFKLNNEIPLKIAESML